MEEMTCDYSGCSYGDDGGPKKIQGFNPRHVEFMMKQHKIRHENDEKKEKEVKNGKGK